MGVAHYLVIIMFCVKWWQKYQINKEETECKYKSFKGKEH